jgi:hypothetical protein
MGINPHWMPAHPSTRRERGVGVTKRGFAPLKLPRIKEMVFKIPLNLPFSKGEVIFSLPSLWASPSKERVFILRLRGLHHS